MLGLAPKWVRLALNGTNLGFFQIRFQCIWPPAPNVLKSDLKKSSRICPIWGPIWPTLESQMYWNLIWKSLGFVPFGANLTHFGGKPIIPGVHSWVEFKWGKWLTLVICETTSAMWHDLTQYCSFHSTLKGLLNQQEHPSIRRGGVLPLFNRVY